LTLLQQQQRVILVWKQKNGGQAFTSAIGPQMMVMDKTWCGVQI